MPINSALFKRGITKESDLPEEPKPIIAIIGRSNVGKSSFINTITSQKKLARTGSRPGVTQQINFFLINKRYYLADLPGYGYAKLSKQARKQLEELIFWFLHTQKAHIDTVIQLIDSKVGPTKDDQEVIEFLHANNLPVIFVASKTDKIKSSQKSILQKNLHNLLPEAPIIPFSIVTNEGKKQVLQHFPN